MQALMRNTYLPNIVTAVAAFSLLSTAIAVCLVSKWRILEKAGQPGWAALVPLYGTYASYRAIYGTGLRSLLLLVPIYGIYVHVRSRFDLARAFDRDPSFGFGLWLLAPVFNYLLGFRPENRYLCNVRILDQISTDNDDVADADLARIRLEQAREDIWLR